MNVMHIVLHLVLCTANVHGAALVRAVHVALYTHIGTTVVDRTIPVSGDNPFDTIADLDAPRGVYLMEVDRPKTSCGATEFVELLPQADRSISLKMSPDGLKPPLRVPTLFSGAAPMGFDYTEPTVVLLDGNVACDKPVGDLLVLDAQTENDADSYYTSIYGYTAVDSLPPQTALRVSDNTGGYHYIRMKIPFEASDQHFPGATTFPINEDLLAYVVSQPEDTLLCHKLERTSSG